MKNNINIIAIALSTILCISLLYSCTDYEAPDMIKMDGIDGDSVISTAIHRKVLWINIDGAVGSVVEKSIPQGGIIAHMLKNSKYSWIGLSDNRILSETNNEDPVTWSTMLTGIIPEKHQINDDSYIADIEYDPRNPNEKVIQYPNIINHIAEYNHENPTLCVTPWERLNKNMLNTAQKTITTTSDTETKDVVLQHIRESNFDFTLVGFSGMLEAGKSGGFTANNAGYINALQQIDNYIGEFQQAINERENAFFEDWLIIITSNHGGTASGGYGGNSAEERNTFGIFYYSHYDEQQMNGKKMYGAYFEKDKTHALVFDTVSANIHYALSENTNFSIEVVMRMMPKKDGTYNGGQWGAIVTKGDPRDKGWGVFRQYSTVSFRIGEYGSSEALEKTFTAFNDPQWHNYTFSINNMIQGSRDWVTALDGQTLGKGTSRTNGQLDEVSPIQINKGGIYKDVSNVPTPFYISEIRLWKRALSETEIVRQATVLDIQPTDDQFKDLLSYWKFLPSEMKDDSKPDTLIIKNQISNGLDLYYINTDKENTRPLKEKAFVELSNTFPAYITSGNLVMENTLVVPQILYWLGISTNTVLDGSQFINNFAHSEDWREAPEE